MKILYQSMIFMAIFPAGFSQADTAPINTNVVNISSTTNVQAEPVSKLNKGREVANAKNAEINRLKQDLRRLMSDITLLTAKRKRLREKGQLTVAEQRQILIENNRLWAKAKRLEKKAKSLIRQKHIGPLSQSNLQKDITLILAQCNENQQSIMINPHSPDQRLPASKKAK